MTGQGTSHAHLLVYRFAPGAQFQGQLVGAIERIESGGTLRILDLLFVQRDEGTGELTAIDVRGRGQGRSSARCSGFRLDAGERRRASAKALGSAATGELLQRLGDELEPGAAVAAMLVEHVWMRALDDAASRTRGERLSSDFVDAGALAELDIRG